MLKHLLLLITLTILLSGCTSSVEKQSAQVKKVQPKNVEKKKVSRKSNSIKTRNRLCGNIKSLKEGMSLEEVHNRLGFGSDKKYAFTKPLFYIGCYESDIVISYANFKFYFDQGCTFRNYIKPIEKEIEETMCSNNPGKIDPPELVK